MGGRGVFRGEGERNAYGNGNETQLLHLSHSPANNQPHRSSRLGGLRAAACDAANGAQGVEFEPAVIRERAQTNERSKNRDEKILLGEILVFIQGQKKKPSSTPQTFLSSPELE